MRLLRTPTTRRLVAATSGLALALSLAACSGDGSSRPDPSDGPSSGAAASPDPEVVDTDVPETTPPKDDFPKMEFDVPLAAGVTDDQLQRLVDEGMLPTAPAHGGAFETMTNAVKAGPVPDVVLFGDSMVQQGVDPQVLGALLSKKAGRDVVTFNGASSRARWGMNAMLARYLVKIDHVPKVALLGITTRAGEHDSFYNTEGAHSPFSSMVEGCDRPASSNWSAADAAACEKDRSDLRTRFRSGGDQVARALEGKKPQTSLYIDPGSRLRSDGFMIHPGVTKAKAKAVSDERMRRGFPGFPTVVPDGQQQFDEAVKILRDAGTTVLAFELPYSPVHQANLEKAGRNYDARRQAMARELAGDKDVPLFEVKDFSAWWSDGDSRDAIHLAPSGAKKFAVQLTTLPGFTDAVVKGLG
ncbi:SGNH/GDSL hydrolase family protein [Nocardioides plantarum]|uniref:SGNH/GDSL hydrolase family protein n=1 Tax=Nocardioides plantarum TaxID=29299 RepID=A0ABV5KFZ6_9ACTN|nr:SGNH/GDSL hydrolase family protein [Nocardioides plantarum]